MISYTKLFTTIVIYIITQLSYGNTDKNIDQIITDLSTETRAISKKYNIIYINLHKELSVIDKKLLKTKSLKKQVALLIKKEQLKDELKENNLAEISDLSKIRYLKGLQIIKILYEKTLSLDHHFASVATFNEINNLSNPNYYPEFIKLKENISSKQDRKSGFSLPNLLGNNIYTSITHSIVSLFNNNNASKEEKEENMKDVECVLDFTLRMHNELNTIYFETAFLQKSNNNVVKELEQLFVDYAKPIKYRLPLKECRNMDDWDSLREHLNNYIQVLNEASKDESKRYKAHKMQINLEFPIDRLLQFITQYNAHIDQGSKFYEKFSIMLDSYENEKQCATKIPLEYKKLKDNILIAIEKFNTAYKPVEINGSKMKEVLYGINEYD